MNPDITSFGISLAAGIVIEVYKSVFPINITQQIENAFNEAINKCVKNDDITKRTYKSELKKIIEVNYRKNPNANLKDNSITGLHDRFFIEFELALIKREAVYNYIKEARDDSRFFTLTEGQKDIKEGVNELREQIAYLISQSNQADSLKNEYTRQLTQYQKNLEDLNPSIALNNLLALEKSFLINSFNPENALKSNIELLKAKCYSLIPGKKDEPITCYINAYNLNINSIEAKELAAYAYFETEHFQKAENLVTDILLIDEYNPIASALKVVLTDSDSLNDILANTPALVIRNTIFKRFLFICSNKSNKFKDLNNAFGKYNVLLDNSHFDNTKLTYKNYKERVFLVESLIREFGNNLSVSFIRETIDKESIGDKFKILDNFLIGIKKTELDDFKVVKFFHAYFNYLLSENKDSVYLLKDIYNDIDKKHETYLLLVANSLQIEKDFDGAISLINESEQKSEILLYLEMFCFQQKGSLKEYVITTKQYLGTINQVSILDSERIFGIIDYLKASNKLDEFETDDFIQKKQFETDFIKIIIETYITVLKEKNTDKTVKILISIKPFVLAHQNVMYKIRLAKLFYFIKEYEEAYKILNEIVDKNIESEELYYLILSLYNGKLDQKTLKQLIVYWRKSFSINLNLLRIEIELNFRLYDYDTIVEICKLYISEKQDEFILSNYIIALYNSDKEYKKEFEGFLTLICDFDFQHPTSANSVADILNRKAYYKEAFIIYYNAAIKFPESTSAYFMVNIPKELDEEYDIVQEGLFIQYESNGKFNITEVTNKLPFVKKIIGKPINQSIEIDKKIGNLKQYITINKILNKYQALKLQIIAEVNDDNPLSEIPMQSFNFKEHLDSGGNILDFLNDIVGNNNFAEDKKNDTESYHKGEFSFTEIVMSYYSTNFIRAHYELKNDDGGLFQIHPQQYPHFDFSFYDYFILDFSSLLHFYDLSISHKIIYNRKFILPTSTKTLIKQYQSEGLISQGKNYLLNNDFYLGLLEWIMDNCEYKMSDSKLDIVKKLPNREKPSIVYDYFIDISSLMLEFNKSLLITDDIMYAKLFPLNSRRRIGSSAYIMKNIDGI
ncbi:tetratricopeptide repeat protein [Olleya sp. Bg11-27]|uniref:tetratricopeptide repeat protein n=1 Tax=Olleya sp. Bg11-27 TaxID=2058135 RepID=UPI0012FE0B32|nr:hypothetical protein [Olleya sp. Bg11-27]